MILGANNEKMSKSKGNVVNPDDVVKEYGADTLRVYEMFMGPLDASIAWSENGLEGSRRFLDRVWRLYMDEEKGDLKSTIQELDPGKDHPLTKVYHQTVEKVSQDFEDLHFNTGISQLMVFLNEAKDQSVFPRVYAEGFVKLLAPIAPHLMEEIWQALGHQESLTYASWPDFDPALTVDNTVEIVIQLNGKVKARMDVASDLTSDQQSDLALKNPEVAELLDGLTVRKVISVPGRLVNIVAQ